MIAICLHNRSSSLADHQRGRLARIDEKYDLTIGQKYIVVGMGIFENILWFLVRDDTGAPNFCRAALFECTEQIVPVGWHFSLRSGILASGNEIWANPCVAMWGYDTLVHDLSHAAGLGEREPEALEIFLREVVRREAQLSQ
ncbi:MAG: hypothetical protein SGI84_02950 [Gemmatimonadota bacterium]|nr:hypothetical protein [Gemmatimonadota bacterium]